jgi:hypothetical protein
LVTLSSPVEKYLWLMPSCANIRFGVCKSM